MPRLPNQTEPLEGIVYPDGRYPGQGPDVSTRNRQRIRVFLLAVIISLMVSLCYTFLRPAIYESSAILQVTPPVSEEQTGSEASAQYIGVELRQLFSRPLLSGALDKLSGSEPAAGSAGITLADMQNMLTARQIDHTNLIELTASGADRELLAVIINTLIDVYLAEHADIVMAESSADTNETVRQLNDLKEKVETKRMELDRFRKKHNIVTLERNENRILRKLTGLTDSLNRANENKVAAEARLAAIRSAIARGRPVADTSGRDSLASLEQRLVEIQEQLEELEQEFTPHYMSTDPKMKGLVKKRELLEQEIDRKRSEAQQVALAEAEQELSSARQIVADIQLQLDEHRQLAMDFTSRFAEHESLQNELLQLETAYREAQDRQLSLEVDNRNQYPQVQIRERAFPPERPVYPAYMRDAGISVMASLVIGLLALLIYDFLTRPDRQSGGHDIRQVFMVTPDNRLVNGTGPEALSRVSAVPALEHQLPRELSQSEVLDILGASGADTCLLVACLLSGLSPGEAAVLQWSDIDMEAGLVHVRGKGSRAIAITPPLKVAIEVLMPAASDPDDHVWEDDDGLPLRLDDMNSMLLYSAHDAGLTRPMDITAEALRHTYLAFLVRKGVRMNDLSQIAGHIQPSVLASYGVFSPPGAAVPLDPAGSVYPALLSFYQNS